ncbi:Mur ligase domain-containing protein [endosymbiont of Riftia pachyptila]|nr:Mur ligase domain-containing protein [endosymbiont of Riftia pachyptila]
MNRSQTVSLQDLLAGLAEIDAAQERPISCLAIDSRNLCPGGLFLACQGGDRHGLDFTEQALAQGAVAIAWEPNGPEVQSTGGAVGDATPDSIDSSGGADTSGEPDRRPLFRLSQPFDDGDRCYRNQRQDQR